MGLFDSMLKDSESLFLNEVVLDYEYMPKRIKYREPQQEKIAFTIRPLFQNRNGSNILLFGPPGVGKTIATRKVLEELDEQSEDIPVFYINCWDCNSTYKIMLELCKQLSYIRTMNKNTNDLIDVALEKLNKGANVFVFDEFDKVNDFDFLYSFISKLYKKTIILITNYKDKVMQMDPRIKSRLMPELLEFKPYSKDETEGILRERKEFAFVENTFKEDAFKEIAAKTFDLKDIRKGLHLMKEAGNEAEVKASRSIELDHVKSAISKMTSFEGSKFDKLKDDEKKIIELLKDSQDLKIGDLYKKGQEAGLDMSYKTFQRKIAKLEQTQLISAEKTEGGKEGNTKILNIKNAKLNDF